MASLLVLSAGMKRWRVFVLVCIEVGLSGDRAVILFVERRMQVFGILILEGFVSYEG